MSRLIKKPLTIPANVQFSFKDNGNTYLMEAKGPKGLLKKEISNVVTIEQKDNLIFIKMKTTDSAKRPMLGTTQRIISNMLEGVSKGFSKSLVLFGIGYKANMKGRNLELEVGFSHPVIYALPEGIDAKIEQQKIMFTSVNKELLGLTVQNIRTIKKPDAYQGKGFRFENENPVRKTGKKTATAK